MIGRTLNKYQITELVGKGGFGEVYKCHDVETRESYAIKICVNSSTEDIKRFAREVRLMNDITHPNVLNIVFSEVENAPYYFVMPLAKASLDSYIDKLKENHEFALKVFLEICEGINAIHASGKFHRDIKPENVLILRDDKILVSDLGLGKFENRDSTILTSSNVFMGTEGFIPPEYKIKGGTKNADRRGDIYQLGKMLYKILTNENPVLIEPSLLPSPLTYIITKATKDKPEERFQNVGELMDAINNYLASLRLDSNPIKAFEAYIKTSNDLLEQGKYDSSVIKGILQIIYSSKNDETQFFELFDKIPHAIIRKMASDFPKEFNQAFHEYTSLMFNYIANNHLGFSYAETIAKVMKAVFLSSNSIEVKINALKNILISSVYYNRYYAMGIFDELLLSVKDATEAKQMAQMLITEKDSFEARIEALPYKNLHKEFQAVVDFIQANRKRDNNSLTFDEL